MNRLLALAALAAAALAAGCGAPDPHPADTTEAARPLTQEPVIAHWASLQGVLVPLGAQDGPTSTPPAPLTGFSHTPQGAALAAITQSVQLSTAPDAQWAGILSAVAAPGEGRDTYAAHRALLSVTAAVDPQAAPTITGYAITGYSTNAADVDIVQRFPDHSRAVSRSRVVWTGQDWQLDLPLPGEATPVRAVAELPDSFVDLEATK